MAKKRALAGRRGAGLPAAGPEYTVEILGRRIPVSDMRDASEKVDAIISRSGMGASEIGAEFPVRDKGFVIGYVSYNAKVWKGQPGSFPEAELMYDPYVKEAPPPMTRTVEREPFCFAHTHTKDYTRPGELFVRCGWCHAKRVDEEGREYRPVRVIRNNPARRCDKHEELAECQADPSSCRWAGCAVCDDDAKSPVRHYTDTKSELCGECRRKFLQDHRFDDRRGEWVER